MRAAPLESSTVYTDGRVVDVYRTLTVLSPQARNAIVHWARDMTSRGLLYWNQAFDFVTPFGRAALLWDFEQHQPTNEERFQRALSAIRAKKYKLDAFICSTLVWRAYLEGTNQAFDLSQPNGAEIQPAKWYLAAGSGIRRSSTACDQTLYFQILWLRRRCY